MLISCISRDFKSVERWTGTETYLAVSILLRVSGIATVKLSTMMRSVRFVACFSVFAIYCWMPAACSAQASKQNALPNIPVDASTGVSFFYIGDMWSHWRKPMDFYIARDSDLRLHSIDIGSGPQSEGWRAWITAGEMQTLLAQLARLDLDWQHTDKREAFGPWQKRQGSTAMDIIVVSSKGTYKAYLRITRMCDELQKMDSAMPTARLLWQFQNLRQDDGCVIAGFQNPEN